MGLANWLFPRRRLGFGSFSEASTVSGDPKAAAKRVKQGFLHRLLGRFGPWR